MEINKIKKSKIPYFFVAFFVVVFGVDLFYIYISQKTWRGVVIDDSYQKGLKYNQILDDQKKQQKLGWVVEMFFENKGNKTGVLQVNLLDKNSVKIRNAKITVELKRPTQEGFDFESEMNLVGDKYIKKIDFPLRGQWDFIIKINVEDDSFVESKRYVVQ